MIPPLVCAQLDDLPNNVDTLKNYIVLLFGVVGSLTLDNAVLKQQLHEAENALCKVNAAATTSRIP